MSVSPLPDNIVSAVDLELVNSLILNSQPLPHSRSSSEGTVGVEPAIIREPKSFYSWSFSEAPNKRLLPSPEQVREQSKGSQIVRFPDLGVIVKWGTHVFEEEGRHMILILSNLYAFPIPKVYGWCKSGHETFIYMELIQGVTLEQRWPNLSEPGRQSIACQMYNAIRALWRLKQDPLQGSYIGTVRRMPVIDDIFQEYTNVLTYPSVKQFNDAIALKAFPDNPDLEGSLRLGLPDHSPIRFTHGNLHLANIIVSEKELGPVTIFGITNWRQAGWYPQY